MQLRNEALVMTVMFSELLFQRILPFGEINQAMHITFVCYFFPELLTWNSGRWMRPYLTVLINCCFYITVHLTEKRIEKGNEICNNANDFFVYVWIHSQLYSWFQSKGTGFLMIKWNKRCQCDDLVNFDHFAFDVCILARFQPGKC